MRKLEIGVVGAFARGCLNAHTPGFFAFLNRPLPEE